MSTTVNSQSITISETEIARLQQLAGSNDYVDFLNSLNLNVHHNVETLTNDDIQKLYAHSESLTIIAFRNYFDKFFQVVHKKRSKTIALLLSQCLYFQLKTPDVRAYIDEERNNFLSKNPSDCTYKYGYILGNTLQDIANKCVITKSTVSKSFSFLEFNGYIIKQAVSSSIPVGVYKTDERVRIRLNLFNLFKDLICSGFNSLDELNLLPTEFVELYKDIRTAINCKNNMYLLTKHSVAVNLVDDITVDTLIDCYNVIRKDSIITSKRETIKQSIDDILMTYNLPNVVLAMDNYEIFRNITNRHEKYMFTTPKFFTLDVINNFVDTNFINYLKQEKCLELTTHQLNSGYKTLSSARAIVLQRKVKEGNLDQIKLDTYVELINQYGIDNVPTFSTTVIDTNVVNQDNIFNDDVKQQVDNLFSSEDTINYFTQFYFKKIYYWYKDKLELTDVINDAYIIACELLQQNAIEHHENIKSYISLKLRGKYSKQFKFDNATVSTKTNEHYIFDFVNMLNPISDDIIHQREHFDCSHIFNLQFSQKKILYQILFCLATSDDIVSNFAYEYKILLNNFYFYFHNRNKNFNFINNKYMHSDRMIPIISKIKTCIDDYCLIQYKELLELFNENDLLTDDLWCEVLIDDKKYEMSIEDIFLNNRIENASQIVHIPMLHKKNKKFNQLLYYVAHKINSSTVHNKTKQRIK